MAVSSTHGVVLADDHPIVREGIRTLMSQEPDLRVVGEAEDAISALSVVATTKPAAVIVDIALGRDNGLNLIRDLRLRHPELAILALSMHDERLFAERALRAGASGYVMKQEATKVLLEAVRRVIGGNIYVSASIGTTLLRSLQGGPQPRHATHSLTTLTDRELDVFRLIGMGIPTREIAQQLHISVKTVEAHRARIKTKLDITSSSELIIHAAHWVANEGGAPNSDHGHVRTNESSSDSVRGTTPARVNGVRTRA
jgi:DNA-binding NarL/FixJ family response regulator